MIIEIKNFNFQIINEVSNLILLENPNTIIAKIGKNFLINFFLKKCISSSNLKLFVYIQDDKVIAYAIIANKQKFLNEEFTKFKLFILKKIIFNLKILQLINLFLIVANKDLVLKSNYSSYIIKEMPNLTYLAVSKEKRNQKIGRFFLEKIFNENYKNKYLTVETDNKLTLNFYVNYMKFQIIGHRRRVPKKLYLLLKKI